MSTQQATITRPGTEPSQTGISRKMTLRETKRRALQIMKGEDQIQLESSSPSKMKTTTNMKFNLTFKNQIKSK